MNLQAAAIGFRSSLGHKLEMLRPEAVFPTSGFASDYHSGSTKPRSSARFVTPSYTRPSCSQKLRLCIPAKAGMPEVFEQCHILHFSAQPPVAIQAFAQSDRLDSFNRGRSDGNLIRRFCRLSSLLSRSGDNSFLVAPALWVPSVMTRPR